MPHERGPVRRLFTGPVSPVTFHRLVMASVTLLVVIIPSGALVRLTGSGLGCPDWPGCHGGVVPPMHGHTVIEYSNRVLSAVVVVVAVITYLMARRVVGGPAPMRRWALVAAIAAVAQAPLGGVTVMLDLHPMAVASHFLLSFVGLTAATLVLLHARDLRHAVRRRVERHRQVVSGIMLALLSAVVVTGVMATASGPHPGDPEVRIRFWNITDAVGLHARVVLIFGLTGLLFLTWLWNHGVGDPAVRPLAILFAPLFLIQIGVGEYQYRHQLPWQVILVHVSIIALLYTTAVALAWLIAHPRMPTDHRADAPARSPQSAGAEPDRQVSSTSRA